VIEIRYLGSRVSLTIDGADTSDLTIDDATSNRWSDWGDRYRAALESPSSASAPVLLKIGREIYDWLDTGGMARRWLEAGTGARCLEILYSPTADEQELALLNVPWELIATEKDHLAVDSVRPLAITRRRGDRTESPLPSHRDLSLLFMAASPRGVNPPLAYEAEESAILAATERVGLALAVEESGCAEFLADRLDGTEEFDILHFSCHGDVLDTEAAKALREDGQAEVETGPSLLLESPEGRRQDVSPGQLARCWGQTNKPALLFLSACRTAESTDAAVGSYARLLIENVPVVLGWDGSVRDTDATAFAESFYRELASFETPAYAAAVARRELLTRHQRDPQIGHHWHLARVYLGAGGGGALCSKKGERRSLPKDAGFSAFLDKARKRVPVADARRFVGRRREAQAAIAAFRRDEASGVLLHGMGNLGKSSLAARIANRQPSLTSVVIYEHYDPVKVLEQLAEAMKPGDRRACLDEWRPRIEAHPTDLEPALETLLTGPFEDRPILLIVDDLERILDDPEPDRLLTPVRAAHGWDQAIAGILSAFERDRGQSRLLITSRYDFEARDTGGADRATNLERIALTPFDHQQRDRQWRAKLEIQQRSDQEAKRRAVKEAHADEKTTPLLRQATAIAAGNPGLQELLTTPLLAGEHTAVSDAIERIQEFMDSGKPPESDQAVDTENAAFEFFRRMTFERYQAALSGTERTMLQAASVFGESVWSEDVDPDALEKLGLDTVVPMPAVALDAVGTAAGIDDPATARVRLVALGLIDTYAANVTDHDADGYEVNRLARPLVSRLDAPERKRLAAAAVNVLVEVWTDDDGNWPIDVRSFESIRLALIGNIELSAMQNLARPAVNYLLDDLLRAEAALAVGCAVSDRVALTEVWPDLVLTRRLAEAAGRTEKGQLRKALLRRGLSAETDNEKGKAQLKHEEAIRLIQVGSLDEALSLLNEAVATFERLGLVRERAVSRGEVADVLQASSKPEEALRIRNKELIPIFRSLKDWRSYALTMGKIADVYEIRGEVDEALRIRREEELPIFIRIGDVRSQAATMGKIADVHQLRGEIDEALRIRQKEQLPVFERLGEVSAYAFTKIKIANLLQAKGNIKEAMRIRREELLPVCKQLDNKRLLAVVMGTIADECEATGNLDEALRIRREEQLPVFERLGDVHQRADTMGKIADVLQQCGEADEALRIRREEQLPVYERLDDVRSRAITLQKIAFGIIKYEGLKPANKQSVLEALDKSFDIFKKLGDPEGIANVGFTLAQVLVKLNKSERAAGVLSDSDSAYKQLGDTEGRSRVAELRQQLMKKVGAV